MRSLSLTITKRIKDGEQDVETQKTYSMTLLTFTILIITCWIGYSIGVAIGYFGII